MRKKVGALLEEADEARGERSAAPFVPNTTSLRTLSAAAHECRGCDLYRTATQVVFGAGPRTARVMFVGEQPGDQEDRAGAPFVGPAGALLDKALADAGIPRDEVYVTNAVKHFKWEPRGKRRIHKKPRMSEIKACRPWLEAEIRAVQPVVVVCLGATAAQAVLVQRIGEPALCEPAAQRLARHGRRRLQVCARDPVEPLRARSR